MKKKIIIILCLLLILSCCITPTHVNTSTFDVQRLKVNYSLVCDSACYDSDKKYFDAFPNTFDDFKNVFGYEETSDSVKFGELYSKSLDYITKFFQLNVSINPHDFSNKIINLCIDGEWQADGVNYLNANVVNIVTSSNQRIDCYYNYLDVFACYNDTLRDTLLNCLMLYNDDEVLSFWEFYLDGPENIPIDNALYYKTRHILFEHQKLIRQLDNAYLFLKRKRN